MLLGECETIISGNQYACLLTMFKIQIITVAAGGVNNQKESCVMPNQPPATSHPHESNTNTRPSTINGTFNLISTTLSTLLLFSLFPFADFRGITIHSILSWGGTPTKTFIISFYHYYLYMARILIKGFPKSFHRK